jgi:hypothetical protein
MRGQRHYEPAVQRHWIVVSLLIVLLWVAIPRTDWFRQRFDPVTRTYNAVLDHPVNAALREHKPGDWKTIEAEVRHAAAAGVPQAELLQRVRTQHLVLLRHYLVYAPGRTVLRYGEAVLPALRELQASEPALCVRLAWPKAGPAFDATAHLSQPTAAAYEAAVAEVIARSDLNAALRSRWVLDDPANGPLSDQDLEQGHRTMHAQLEERHGKVIGRLVTDAVRQVDPGHACAATIALFTHCLQQEQRLARRLLASLLRS